MKRLALAAALAGTVALGGCDPITDLSTIGAGISLTTKSIANPVTTQEEVSIEIAVDAGFKALKVYKNLCINHLADKNCRANVAQIQAYTRPMKPLIAQLRSFVDNNDQINASVVYNQLTALYSNVKNYAASVGVNVGS